MYEENEGNWKEEIETLIEKLQHKQWTKPIIMGVSGEGNSSLYRRID